LLIFCNIAVECENSGTNLFSKLSSHSNNEARLCVILERLMKESWETETSTEDREAVDPVVTSLKRPLQGRK
jgi:hypothetical protein